MKLYGSLASPYVARVAMYADLKGIELPMEPAPGGMGSDEYKQINPTGKIPALQTDAGVIAESSVICEYLERVFPQPPLLPDEPMLQARARMVAHMTDLYVAPHNTPLTRMRNSGQRDEALIEKQAGEFATGFERIAAFMAPAGFAAGVAPSLGDCALAPFIGMLKQTVFPHFPEVIDPTESGGRLTEWWAALQAHEGCRRNIEAYDSALESFLKWLHEMLAKRAQAAPSGD